jgi:hypothetical protein
MMMWLRFARFLVLALLFLLAAVVAWAAARER